MKRYYGIDLSQKKVIVNGRLENYIRSGGWKSFNEFMNDVEQDKTGRQEKMLVNLLTTNHTYFMREFEQFDFFARKYCLGSKIRRYIQKMYASGAELPHPGKSRI